MLTDNVDDVINNPEIKVVAQLVGGLEPARTIMLRLLESGKDVVTANKALLAEHGPELFDRARELGRSIAFEASVAGGIPIIANISQCLSANQIESLHGILNGTSNFILTQDARRGRAVRRRARRRRSGWATPRPIRRWTSTAATRPRSWRSSPTWRSAPASIGKTFRARASTSSTWPTCATPRRWATASSCWRWPSWIGDTLELTCRRRWCERGRPLAEVSGPFNAIRVEGDAVGPLFFHGQGAGQMPTASAVVADMIDTAVGRTAITFRTLELWSNRKARVTPREHAEAAGEFYLRVMVEDHPGVLAQVRQRARRAQHFDRLGAAARSCRSEGDVVPLVIMTHETTEGATREGVCGDRQAAMRARRDGADVGERLTVADSDCGLRIRSVRNPQSEIRNPQHEIRHHHPRRRRR